MSLKDWERDVINRQRNIVFPDTNLNEGRFYRNIASGKAVFSRGQKLSLVLIVFCYLSFYGFGLASAIWVSLLRHNIGVLMLELWSSMWLLGLLFFWSFLAVRGLFAAERKRKLRRGYRSQGR
jgi:pilus assembly protein TadC